MAPACRRLALRAPLPTLLLPYLVALPSLGKRDHLFAEVELGETALVVEPGPAKSQNVSEIVGAATEQTLEPLQRTQKELQAKLQGLDAKMVELKDNQTALQEEAQREEKRAQTDEKLKRMYTDLLNKAINGLRALEENYTSNTKEGVQLLRCLNGDCGTLGETSIEVLKRQQEIEQQVMEGQEQQVIKGRPQRPELPRRGAPRRGAAPRGAPARRRPEERRGRGGQGGHLQMVVEKDLRI
ncbi:unnamed protein product [Prorocentrum cordatum]|uniref:Uncharacterized protein n=1 Tax=Prorocentrum cordatum TaxID=2364126 RepID=A0ABN9UF81_9DINO|nr:unnamed protein product [Polarella glacialis]